MTYNCLTLNALVKKEQGTFYYSVNTLAIYNFKSQYYIKKVFVTNIKTL